MTITALSSNTHQVTLPQLLDKVNELVAGVNASVAVPTLTIDVRNSFQLGGQTIANTATIWTSANDGSTSGLDADLLDGHDGDWYVSNTYFAAQYTGSNILTKLLTVDGSGSGLDADLLDGRNGDYYVANTYFSGANILTRLLTVDGSGTNLDADLLDGHDGDWYVSNTYFAAQYTASNALTKIKTVDGTGSGLDADLLDGLDSAAFAQLAGTPVFTTDVAVSKAAGNFRGYYLKTGSVNRWRIVADDAAETGTANAGSAFVIARYADDGTLIGDAFKIVRGTGAATLSGTLTATSYDTSSDERLKTDITPYDVDDRVLDLQIMNYRFEQYPDDLRTGLIAQQVQQIFPDLVREDSSGHLTIDYTSVIMRFLRKVQEQEQRLTRLEQLLG